jgi:diguanylate cyclase (GGDEF)-like protein
VPNSRSGPSAPTIVDVVPAFQAITDERLARRARSLFAREAAVTDDERAAVRLGTLVHALRQLRLALPANSAAAAVYALAIAPAARRSVAVGWLAVFLVVEVARVVVSERMRAALERGHDDRSRLLLLLTVVDSVLWGALPLLFATAAPGPESEWQVLALSTGLTMAASIVFAGRRSLFLAWLLPVWAVQASLVTAARLLPDHGLFLVFALSAVIAISVLFHSSSAFVVDTVLFRHRNAVLVAALEERRAQLAHDATHDVLTGLLNRAGFEPVLREALRAAGPGCEVGLVFVDLDRFKEVNDSLGHGAGDRLLHEVAVRLRATVGPDADIGRFGGDEFVVLLRTVAGEDEIASTARRLCTRLSEAYVLDGVRSIVSASAGWASSSDRACDPAELLAQADRSMYEAKHRDRAGRVAS